MLFPVEASPLRLRHLYVSQRSHAAYWSHEWHGATMSHIKAGKDWDAAARPGRGWSMSMPYLACSAAIRLSATRELIPSFSKA